jgi:hypothetical protein
MILELRKFMILELREFLLLDFCNLPIPEFRDNHTS